MWRSPLSPDFRSQLGIERRVLEQDLRKTPTSGMPRAEVDMKRNNWIYIRRQQKKHVFPLTASKTVWSVMF